MENRYFCLLNLETLSVYLSEELEVQPENSLPFSVYNFKNPVFNQYPNPTAIVEGVEIIEPKTLIELIRERYSIDDELAIQRQRLEKPDEFQEYFNFVENCKTLIN